MHRSPNRLRNLLLGLSLVASAMIAVSLPAGAAGEALGIDVSHYQGTINWSKVAGAGKSFAFLKATQGTGYSDPTYVTNRTNANAAGIPTGAYHFANVTTSPSAGAGAKAEADWFVSVSQPRAGDLPPVFDIETAGGLGNVALTDWAMTWLERVRQLTGIYPMVYTAPYPWADKFGSAGNTIPESGYALLWVAHYTTDPSPIVPAGNWANNGWTFWQYTSSGTVPGISGPVDLDRYESSNVSSLLLRQLTITKTSVAGKIGGVKQDGLGAFCDATCLSATRLSVGGASTTLSPQSTDANTTWTWGGACTGSAAGGPCTISMATDQAVTITYRPITAPITVAIAGTGSGSIVSNAAGISCTATAGVASGTCTAPFAYGSSVTLTATATSGSTFTGWSAPCSGTGTCTVTADAAKTVTATFQPSAATFTLTASVTGTGTGSVVSAPTIACPGVCSADYASGSTASVTQGAGAGSRFVGWSGVCTGTGSCSPVMTANRSVTAVFSLVANRTLTPTSVSIAVRKGSSALFQGSLTTSDARCSASNQTVTLWSSTGTSAIASTKTNSSGVYSFSRRMSAIGTFTFVVKAGEITPSTLGNVICGAATSVSVTVTVSA